MLHQHLVLLHATWAFIVIFVSCGELDQLCGSRQGPRGAKQSCGAIGGIKQTAEEQGSTVVTRNGVVTE